MTSRAERAPTLEPARNRCRCGHFPSNHMRVVASPSGGGFQLDPVGPCAICKETACARYTPAV